MDSKQHVFCAVLERVEPVEEIEADGDTSEAPVTIITVEADPEFWQFDPGICG